MKARDLLQETHESLIAKKGRSVLTVIGIVIGIMAVVVMVSVITGFSAWLEASMGLGSARVITISAGDDTHQLTRGDAEFLATYDDELDAVLPYSTSYLMVGASDMGDAGDRAARQKPRSPDEIMDSGIQVVGVDSPYFDVQSMRLISGALYSDEAGNEIVLDETAVKSIYGEGSDPIGTSLELGKTTFSVVGVVEASSETMMFGMSFGYISHATMAEKILGDDHIDSLIAAAKSGIDVDACASRALGMLYAHHNIDPDEATTTQSVTAYGAFGTEEEEFASKPYTAMTMKSQIESLRSFTLAFDALAGLVAGIALLVGGIGIMNMMLTNVSERIGEIGLRKSLGARPRDIQLQFLSESVALCLTGGVAGIICGYAGAWVLVGILPAFNPDLAGIVPVITPTLLAMVFLVCFSIGVIFGFYPARRAAKLNPAETLRYQ